MSTGITAPSITYKHFRSPKTVISRFVARRTMRGAAFWAIVFGAIVTSKSVSYASLYPTASARIKLASSFSNNIGLNALFGAPHHIETVAGYAVWNTMAGPVIIGAVWAFLLATKSLRGEEVAGRWELLLAGQTSSRKATANALVGLGASLGVLYCLTALAFIGIGKIHTVDFGTTAALFFALATVSSAVLFMAVGALTSQLMPTRSRAASLAAVIFGVCFLIRSVADTTNAHWLLNVTPLGWIERLQPLYGSQALWLLPIGGLILLLIAATIFLAGQRDLGDSIIADTSVAKPRLALLGTPFAAAFRLNRTVSLSWLTAMSFIAVFFGFLTKTATNAISSSSSFEHDVKRVVHGSQAIDSTTFLGVIFFLIMPLLMSYVASAISKVREDEAEGYIDNFLVRPISRLQWLWGRIILIISIVIVAGVLSGVSAWIGVASQHSGVTFYTLLLAGLNIVAPAILILGIGTAAMGIIPRATTFMVFGYIAWSFLLQIISSGLNLNHWLLDTSILHHIALAPAVSPVWSTTLSILGISFVLILIGMLRFNSRDLENE